jgi:formate-dependent nitrite reductase membrane component NrfD
MMRGSIQNDSFRRTFLIDLRNQLGLENAIDLDDLYKSRSADQRFNTRINPKVLWIGVSLLAVTLFIFYYFRNKADDFKITAAVVVSTLSLIVAFFNRV